MNLINAKTGREIKDTTTLSGVLDNLFVPMWKAEGYSDKVISSKRYAVIEWAMKHPNADKHELAEFMGTV